LNRVGDGHPLRISAEIRDFIDSLTSPREQVAS
jgi:hypothetical protein